MTDDLNQKIQKAKKEIQAEMNDITAHWRGITSIEVLGIYSSRRKAHLENLLEILDVLHEGKVK